MPMLSQTYIGKYCEGGQELSVFTKSIPGQDNDSYVILGESGYGKSVAAQSIVLQKANQSYSVRSIDIHNSSAPNISFQFSESHLNICPHKLMHTTRPFQQRFLSHCTMRMELWNHLQI